MEVTKISEREIRTIKKQKGKVLIECYATWCGACKMMSQVMMRAVNEISNCKFYKIDIDTADEVAIEYQIESVPTILLFEDGKLIKKEVGLMTTDELNEMING